MHRVIVAAENHLIFSHIIIVYYHINLIIINIICKCYTMNCSNYYYYNTVQNKCELCHPNQVIYGILSWCIFTLQCFCICYTCNPRIFPCYILILIIAINQFTCDRKWDTTTVNTILMLEVIISLISTLITKNSITCNNTRRNRRRIIVT